MNNVLERLEKLQANILLERLAKLEANIHKKTIL